MKKHTTLGLTNGEWLFLAIFTFVVFGLMGAYRMGAFSGPSMSDQFARNITLLRKNRDKNGPIARWPDQQQNQQNTAG